MIDMADMTGKDVYLRVTDTHRKQSTLRHHRAWDVDRFIESQRAAYRAEGEKPAPGQKADPMRFVVSLASAEEYRAANWRATP